MRRIGADASIAATWLARVPILRPSSKSIEKPDFAFEKKAMKRGLWPVAGLDEAGRGPLAGPVVAAAVILDPKRIPKGSTIPSG